jgi:TNF receptor-associated protein 1
LIERHFQTQENKDELIEENEVVTGKEEVHEFKTETKKLLSIVANSLYSEKEVSDFSI